MTHSISLKEIIDLIHIVENSSNLRQTYEKLVKALKVTVEQSLGGVLSEFEEIPSNKITLELKKDLEDLMQTLKQIDTTYNYQVPTDEYLSSLKEEAYKSLTNISTKTQSVLDPNYTVLSMMSLYLKLVLGIDQYSDIMEKDLKIIEPEAIEITHKCLSALLFYKLYDEETATELCKVSLGKSME
ncbi:MAG: hypothetical protein ATN36_00675 [Epulopiscium sp. Nele67-Bin005]|nr:MAG: hypothetical protein ATN36_00675 [Epulopiscium sp. Nele67-Bin005]